MCKKEISIDVKVRKLLKFMQEGMKIEYDGAYYAMNSKYRIGVCILDANMKPTDKVLDSGLDGLEMLYHLAYHLSDEEYYGICADYTLNAMKENR